MGGGGSIGNIGPFFIPPITIADPIEEPVPIIIPQTYYHQVNVKLSNTGGVNLSGVDISISGAQITTSTGITDDNGVFGYRFTVVDVTHFDIAIEVKHEGHLLYNVTHSLVSAGNEVVTSINVLVDRYYVARGKTQLPNNSPLEGLKIVAYDRAVGISKELGTTTTASNGSYKIEFWTHDLVSEFSRVAPNLLLKVFDPQDEEITNSELITNPTGNDEVNFEIDPAVYGGPSEFDRYYSIIESELESILVDGIDANDYILISQLTGADISQVNHLLDAINLAEKTGIEAEWLFGLFRRGIPSTLDLLGQSEEEEIRIAFEESMELNQISILSEIQIDEIITKIKTIKVNKDLAFAEDSGRESLLGVVLGWSGLSLEEQTQLYLAFITNRVSEEEFWLNVVNDELISQAQSEAIRLYLDLGAICDQEEGIFTTLIEKYQLQAVYETATLDYDDWFDILQLARDKNRIPHISPEEDPKYIRAIEKNRERMIPTALLVQLHNLANPIIRDPVWIYLEENLPFFDYKNQNINEYIDTHPETITGYAEIKSLRHSLNRIQRVFLLAPAEHRPKVTLALLKLELDAANKIIRIGEITFVKYYKDGLDLDDLSVVEREKFAKRVFLRAKKQAALLRHIHGTYGSSFNNLPMYGIQQDPKRLEQKAHIPGLNTIFEAQEISECEHCTSVLSPSAYFLDLLTFLDEAEISREGTTSEIFNETALDLLFERRPDLRHLVLNCDNTNIPLSYLDLVNEVLENAINTELESLLITQTNKVQYRLRGKFVSEQVNKSIPLKDAYVQLFLSGSSFEQLLGEAKTDRYGKFEITIYPENNQSLTTSIRVIYQQKSLTITDTEITWDLDNTKQERLFSVNPNNVDSYNHQKQLAYLKGNDIWTISGQLQDEQGNVLKDCTVMAWDHDAGVDDLLGISALDTKGKFKIHFHASSFQDSSRDLNPDPYIVVIHKSQVIYFQHLGFNLQDNVDMGIIQLNQSVRNIKRLSVQKQGSQTVSGVITEQQNGQPLEGIRVMLVQTTSGINLGDATTNESGEYELRFDKSEWNLPGVIDINKFTLTAATSNALTWSDDVIASDINFTDLQFDLSIPLLENSEVIADKVNGEVVNQYSSTGSEGYLVEAWKEEGENTVWLGNALTQLNGSFSIPLNFDATSQSINLLFKIFDGDDFIYQTHPQPYEIKIAGGSKSSFAKIINPYFGDAVEADVLVLKGRVIDEESSKPIANAQVAFWENSKGITGFQFGVFTDEDGNFEENIRIPIEFLEQNTSTDWNYKVLLKDKILFDKHQSFSWSTNKREKYFEIKLNSNAYGFSMVREYYSIRGKLTNIETGAPLRGCTIEAWDYDADNNDDLLGIARTDLNGDYDITFDSQYFRDHILDNDPDIYYKVLQNGTLIQQETTQEEVKDKVIVKNLQATPLPEIQISGTRGPLLGAVYETLAATTFPWKLPFDLHQEECKLYLSALGINKEELIQRLNPLETDVLAESLAYLKISKNEFTALKSTGIKSLYDVPTNKPIAILNNVHLLLDKTRLSFEQLKKYVNTRYVNPTYKEVQYGSQDTTLLFSNDEYLNLHRMRRLCVKTGLEPDDLDNIIASYEQNNDVLNTSSIEPFILHLAQVTKLHSRGIPIHTILSWHVDLNKIMSFDGATYYNEVIVQPSVSDDKPSIFALDASGDTLENVGLMLINESGQLNEQVTTALLNILQIDKDNLLFILTKQTLNEITIPSLSLLYRIVSFTKNMSISVDDYYLYREIIGFDPVFIEAVVSPDQTIAYMDALESIRKSEFSIQEIVQIYSFDQGNEYVLNEGVLTLYDSIKIDFEKIDREGQGDTPEDRTKNIINGKKNALSQKLSEWLSLDEDLLNVLLETKVTDSDVSINQYCVTSDWFEETANLTEFGKFIHWVSIWENVIAKLELQKTELEFLNQNPINTECYIPQLSFVETQKSFNLNNWKQLLQVIQFNKLLTRKDKPGFIDLLSSNYQWIENNPSPSQQALTDGKSFFVSSLSELTGWQVEDLEFLIGDTFHQWAFPQDFLDTEWFSKLESEIGFFSKTGILTSQLSELQTIAIEDFKSVHSELLLLALKSKTPPGQWDEKLNQLKDKLRENQKEALQTFLLSRDTSVANEDDIYARYLVDTEMSTAMQTSRIKQGISSVQLMVQRIRMGLEPGISFNKEDMKEWAWRKSYRVWEANRRIFLYPENWIEPELRDDKSSIFKTFEDELLQGEINSENVEKAYRKYLNQLDEISHLEISGVCHQVEENLYHVFARTRNLPHKYFYRKWVGQYLWTPWEEVQLDIEGDHLIPVFWNRKLWLFWPVISEMAEEPAEDTLEYNPSSGGTPVKGVKPKMKLEMKLAVSQYQEGNWLPKKLSIASFKCPMPNGFTMSDEAKYPFMQFSTSGNDNQLRISAYVYSTEAGRFNIDVSTDTITAQAISGLILNTPFVGGVHKFDKLEMNASVFKVDTKQVVGPYKPYQLTTSIEEDRPLSSWFYEDDESVYLVQKVVAETNPGLPSTTEITHSEMYQFRKFYHPYTGFYKNLVNRYGVVGLFDPPNNTLGQQLSQYQRPVEEVTTSFKDKYKPGIFVDKPYPVDSFSFELTDSYSSYNWELFFHAPITVALRLSQNQRFEEAQQWFHYIFDPTQTEGEAPRRFWRIKPFHCFDDYSDIREIVKALNSEKEEHTKQVEYWEKNPFNPHVIARMRIVAYMRMVVMKYLDNLIDWGDQLFRGDSIESLNEATQVYILASQVLGKRPVYITKDKTENLTVADIFENLDIFSNALVEVENQLPNIDYEDLEDVETVNAEDNSNSFNSILYFCIPQNDQLLKYWETVADRLYKIRQGMNIDGVKRQLKLFEPPIDPGMLVKAAAGGVDIGSALNELEAGSSVYRYSYLLPKAIELCNDVKSLGGALLSALEKKDSERMALLRSTHEIAMLKSSREIKKKAIEEAEFSINSLLQSKVSASKRFDVYKARINEGNTALENSQIGLSIASTSLKGTASDLHFMAAPLALFPGLNFGVSGAFGSPVATVEKDFAKLSSVSSSVANAIQSLSGVLDSSAGILATYASWERREQDWQLQKDLAEIENEQILHQIDAAIIRQQMAIIDLQNHEKQMEQSLEVKELMETKYTNQQLYNWMIRQISSVYFQSYQLAYDLAKKAEKAYAFELGIDSPGIVEFGHWDSLKKGLLSGEKLQLDLRRLEAAYMDQNKREQELSKHISLKFLNSEALLALKETGKCEFDIPEVIFDLDHPGQYMRRIKSISLTIPCITGPYTSVSGELTMLSSTVRKNTSVEGGYGYIDINDNRFNHDLVGIQTISTSSAQNDSGVFELNFRDERYLPFEGAGAVSKWRFEMPKEFRQFDYDSISDIIVQMNYTARLGGDSFKSEVERYLKIGINSLLDYFAADGTGLQQWFSLKTQFPSSHHELFIDDNSDKVLEAGINLNKKHFPYIMNDRELELKGVTILVKPKEGPVDLSNVQCAIGKDDELVASKDFSDFEHHMKQVYFPINTSIFGEWKIKLSGVGIDVFNKDIIDDIFYVFDYEILLSE